VPFNPVKEPTNASYAHANAMIHEPALGNDNYYNLTMTRNRCMTAISCDTAEHATRISIKEPQTPLDTNLKTSTINPLQKPILHSNPKMSFFELSNHVEGGRENARDLAGSLKALQQTLKNTNTDITILQHLNVCVFKAQELSTESFLFIEKEANK
jgi:hypothetical protein